MSVGLSSASPGTPPAFSLIVATTGRVEPLQRLFVSLTQERFQDFEVVLVDQSHDDKVALLARAFSDRLQLRHLRDDGRGLSRARNLGLRQASGAYLGFPDDDCWYHGDVLGEVFAYFDRNPDTGIYSGIYTEPGRDNPNFPTNACALSVRNFWGRGCSVGLFLNRQAIGNCPLSFDERIGAGTDMAVGEEVDLMMRLLLKGVKGYYDPSLYVYHAIHREKTLSRAAFTAVRRAYGYLVGKNYRPIFTEARLARAVAGCMMARSPHGIVTDLSAVLTGFREGLRMRRSSNAVNLSRSR